MRLITIIGTLCCSFAIGVILGCQDSGVSGTFQTDGAETLDGSFHVFGTVTYNGEPMPGAYVEVEVNAASKWWAVAHDWTNNEGEYQCPDCSPPGCPTRVHVDGYYSEVWVAFNGDIYEVNIELGDTPGAI